MRILITLVAFITFSHPLWAAEVVENPGPGVDQDSYLPWITKEEVKNNPYHITLGLETPASELILNSTGGGRAVFAPSLRGLFAVGVSDARFFGVTAAFPLRQDEDDKLKKGATDYSDFRFNFALQKSFIQVGYTQYRGFYISNSGQVDNTWTGGAYLRADDLYKRTIYANVTYIGTPRRYSIQSAIGQTARQVLSGGSWLWGYSAREEKLENPSEIIPSGIRSDFGLDQNMSRASMRSVFIRGGYGYQYNFTENFFVNAYIMAGLGLKQLNIEGPNLNYKDSKTSSKLDAQLSLVNNGKTYFGGGRALIDNAAYTARDLKIESNFYTFTLFIGRRLH